jgi:hypothetical protein
LEDPTRTESAKPATSNVGSARAATVTARLEPMPPNAVPVSRPASASATEPRSSSDTTA